MSASKELVLLAAQASQLAYGCSVAQAQALGFSLAAVLHDEATDTQGIVLVNDQLVIVAFRGTESIKDWMTDAKVRKVTTEHPEFYGQFKLHCGFRDAFKSVLPQLHALTNEQDFFNSHRPVYFTGHSLGGALAVIAAICFTGTIGGVITFGQPRVGDGDFAETYSKILGYKTTRVVNGLDAVTLMPPWLMGDRHFDSEVIFIDSAGEVLVNPHPVTRVISHAFCVVKDWMHIRWVTIGGWSIPLPFRLSAVRNHFMMDYLKALEGWR